MNTLLLSLIIGITAGIVDIIPMIIQKLDKRSIASAFLQYFFISIIIVHINLPYVAWWLQGSLISLALTIPIVIIISAVDKKSVPIILTNSVVLGVLIGIAAHFLK